MSSSVETMDGIVEIMKCYNPNNSLPMCRECLRNGESGSNEYETFDLNKTLMNGWKCDGYLSLVDRLQE